MNHVTNKPKYSRWYVINPKDKSTPMKKIWARSPQQAFAAFLREFPGLSQKRIDYIIS